MASEITIITSGINRLAKVEIELILQFLDIGSLVKTARCSKRLYDDTNSKESFKMLPAINLCNNEVTVSQKLMLNHPQLQFIGNMNYLDHYPLGLQKAISTLSLTAIASLYDYGEDDDNYKDNLLQKVHNFLKINTNLTTLVLCNILNQDNEFCMENIITICHKLKKLSLYGNIINSGVAIAKGMMLNNTLTSLNLTGNQISSVGVAAIAVFLEVNNTLTSLNLSSNHISNIGVAAVAAFLEVNNTLTILNLSYNEISDAGAIATLLKVNCTLTTLELSGNIIRDGGVRVLLRYID